MSKENTIKVIVLKPYELAEIKEIENSLETFQSIVGGYIEVQPLDLDRPYLFICNEEGKLKGYDPNFAWYDDVVVGTVIFTIGNDEGDFISLTEEQIDEILEILD